MKKAKENITNQTVEPYKGVEFEKFLELIGNENIQNWTIMAQVLGVGRETIVRWKQHPQAKQAIGEAINNSMKNMERSGARDWRMHREKLKMLGVEDNTNIDIKSDGEEIKLVLDLGK